MLEERLTGIENGLNDIRADVRELRTDAAQLHEGQAALRTDVAELREGQAELRTDVAGLHSDVRELRTDVEELRTGQVVLGAGLNHLRARVGDIDHQMRVLHEDVIDRIKAIPDPTEARRQEMKAGFARLEDALDRRLGPLELTVREHSVELARLRDNPQ